MSTNMAFPIQPKQSTSSIENASLAEAITYALREAKDSTVLLRVYRRVRLSLIHPFDYGTIAAKHWPCDGHELLLCVLRGLVGAAEDTRMPMGVVLPRWNWESVAALEMMCECLQLLTIITVIDDVDAQARQYGTIDTLTRLLKRMTKLMMTGDIEQIELAAQVMDWASVPLGRLASPVASRGVVTQTYYTSHSPVCGVCEYPGFEVARSGECIWSVDLRLAEGTFTSGGLGFEVWPGAQVFATWLLEGELGIHVRNKDVLELGAGCGLAGVLTAIFAKSVVMTDGEVALTPTLEQNRSEAKMGAHMASVLQPALVLRWGGETPDLYTPVEDGVLVTGDLDRDRKLHFGSREADELGTYEVIIAADIIYHTGHIATAIVTDIIPRYLKLDGRFFLVIPPERDGSDDFLQAAREAEAQERISMTVERAPRHYIPQQFRDKLDAGVGFRLVTIQRRDK